MSAAVPTSDFLHVLQERGFLHQCSDLVALDAKAKAGGLTAYIGFDCTARSLHVGSLLPIMVLRWLQKSGGRPIVLVGGGTTRVGDPSGKDESRKLLTIEEIERNKRSLQTVFSAFLRFGDGASEALMVDNADWLTGLNYLDFLREVGRHFSVNRMLSMDSVKMRLERDQELSFLEFNYMCCQAYDFVELHRRLGVTLQMGGSDQWGNIVTGIDLGRRMGTAPLYALTTPLLTTASGAKMGKTAQGAVWLDAELLPVFEYWQFWRNCDDGDVGRFLRLFTELPMDEVARLEHLGGGEINEAKDRLATLATSLLHGEEAAERARSAALTTFSTKEISLDLPSFSILMAQLNEGYGLLNALVHVGMTASNAEARNKILGGGIRVNDRIIEDVKYVLRTDDLIGDVIKLSLGKKRHVLLRLS